MIMCDSIESNEKCIYQGHPHPSSGYGMNVIIYRGIAFVSRWFGNTT